MLKAHPPVLPTATTAVNTPVLPLCTRLTMCQAGLADVAATADAVAVTTPVTASRPGLSYHSLVTIGGWRLAHQAAANTPGSGGSGVSTPWSIRARFGQ